MRHWKSRIQSEEARNVAADIVEDENSQVFAPIEHASAGEAEDITCTAEPKTPGVPWCFEFFVPNIKHKGTPRILSKLLKPRTSLVFRGVLKPTKFFYVLKTPEHHGTPQL